MSGVYLRLKCSGCDATATTERGLRRTFHSLDGRGYGFGSWATQPLEEIAPEGWVLFDPYTQVTYCPDCWRDITDDATEETLQKEEP